MNNGLNYLKRGFSTLSDSLPQPSLHNISVTYPQKKNESGKRKKIEITENVSSIVEKVDEYTSSSENNDNDGSDSDNDDKNGDNSDSIEDSSGDVISDEEK